MSVDGAPAAALKKSLAELIEESQRLRLDVQNDMESRRRATKVAVALLGLLSLFTALMLVLAWQNNQVLDEVNRTGDTVADCTTAGGKCYEEGRARTGQAIQDILNVSIFMAECARLYPGESGPEYDKKLERCIYERLQAQNAPTPSPSGG